MVRMPLGAPSSHLRSMNRYYALHAKIYDPTRWMFLFDRNSIVEDMDLGPGERVLEVGCGTGANLELIRRAVGPQGEVLAVDCAESMVSRARERVRRHGWQNVSVLASEYGSEPLRPGWASAVLFSYSLSMIPEWDRALDCAQLELAQSGRIGVVDFNAARDTLPSRIWARWMRVNHVHLDRPCLEGLEERFTPRKSVVICAWRGLWTYYRFVGERRDTVVSDSASGSAFDVLARERPAT